MVSLIDRLILYLWKQIEFKFRTRQQRITLALIAVCAFVSFFIVSSKIRVWQIIIPLGFALLGSWFIYFQKITQRKIFLLGFIIVTCIYGGIIGVTYWLDYRSAEYFLIKDLTQDLQNAQNEKEQFHYKESLENLDKILNQSEALKSKQLQKTYMIALAERSEIETINGVWDKATVDLKICHNKAETFYNVDRGNPDNIEFYAHILYLEGELNRFEGVPSDYYKDSINLYNNLKDAKMKKGLADTLLGKGRQESGSTSEADHVQAKIDCGEADKIYSVLQSKSGKAGVLLCYGDNENNIGDTSTARAHYKDSHDLFHEIKNKLGEAEVLIKMADLDAVTNHLDMAKTEYGDGLKLYTKINSDWGQGNGLVGLAGVIVMKDLYDSLDKDRIEEMYGFAKNYYEEADEHFNNRNSEMQKVNLLVGRSYVEARQCDFSSANKNLDIANNFFYKMENKKGMGEIELARGFLARAMRKPEEATKRYQYAISIFEKLNDKSFLELAKLGLGNASKPLTNQVLCPN